METDKENTAKKAKKKNEKKTRNKKKRKKTKKNKNKMTRKSKKMLSHHLRQTSDLEWTDGLPKWECPERTTRQGANAPTRIR